jgi:hypothetical protein
VVVTIRNDGVVCKIIGGYSDGTSEHEEWFESGRRIVYKESVVGVGGFPFLLSLLVLLYSKASYDFENSFDSCLVLISSKRISSTLSCPFVTNITYARPRPLH